MQIFQRLRGHVIEIDYVSDGVYDGKEERRAGDHLVERYMGIQRYVLLNGEILELCQQVPGHGQQQETVAKR